MHPVYTGEGWYNPAAYDRDNQPQSYKTLLNVWRKNHPGRHTLPGVRLCLDFKKQGG